MLLTGGQISMVISSFVVFTFTFLLFLSGYVLQQQTVRNIQAAIKPPPLPSIHAGDSSRRVAKTFGSRHGSSSYDKYLASNRPRGGWARVAYVQLVREHLHVCNTVMLFAALEREESLARKVLLYPKEWHLGQESPVASKLQIETSLRLLKNAEKRYKVELQPVDRMQASAHGEVAYPLSGLLSLTMFNRLVSLQPSGLIVDSGKLDLLFTLPMESETFGISAGSMETEIIPPVLLLEPSMRAYNESLPSILARTYSDANFLQNISKTARTAENQTHLVSKTSAIHLEDDSFDFSSFLENTAYVQISDPGMPGPDFDIPRSKLLRARPKRAEQRKVWEAVYERYRDQRMEVCGLDLEPETTSIPASSMDAQQENQQENPHEADHEQAILMPTEHD